MTALGGARADSQAPRQRQVNAATRRALRQRFGESRRALSMLLFGFGNGHYNHIVRDSRANDNELYVKERTAI